jgi:hypothetical protein
MRVTLFRFPLLALALSLSLAARADTIDDFTLTGNGHTISYSLPATSSYPDFSLFNFFQESAANTTVDGVSGYVESGDYYDTGIFPYVSLILSVPTSVSSNGDLYLKGPAFISFAFVPAPNPSPYLPYDVVPTFIPGTYTLQDLSPSPGLLPYSPPISYTLTITPEAPTVTPEPSTFALLGTGALGLLGVAKRRRRKV